MTRRWAGALGAALLLAGGVARAERPKILVLPVAGTTADAGFRQRVARALSEGLMASGGEVVAPTATALPEGCTTAACLSGAARATGAAFLLRATVEEEGRSYAFKLEMLDGQSGALLAQRENRCEICTDAEALEIANAAASALKAQALKKSSAPAAPPTASPAAAPAAERPAGPRARVAIVDKLELPASLAEFHGKLRTALEALVREQGLDVVTVPAPPAGGCTTPDCQKDQMRDAGASHVLFVEGSRNDYGFSLDITMRGVGGEESEKAQGWCNFCTGPQMVTAAENVARPLVVHLAARPDRAPGAASGVPGTNLNAQAGEGKSGSKVALVVLGAGLAAVGAATVVSGSVIWNRAGELTDCVFVGVERICREEYGGRGLGIGMVIGGALLAGVGGYLMLFTNTQVVAGPGGVAVAGRF
jgi:hypothetical protein